MKNKFTTRIFFIFFLSVFAHISTNAQVTLTVDSPASVAGVYETLSAGFGDGFPGACNDNPAITGDLVIGIDGTDPTSDACETVTNDLTGKIALIDRGACSFSQKVFNAQEAGAIAVIVCNNVTDPIFNMGATAGFDVTVPAYMVSLSDCNTIRAAIPTVSVTIDFNLVEPAENITVLWEADLTPTGSQEWSTQANVPDSLLDVWMYDENGTFPTAGGGTVEFINGWSVCDPAWGFPGRYYQTNRTGDNAQIATDAANYEEYNSELVSPSIDLSAVTSDVSLKFDQYFQRLNANNGNPEFASIEFSIDGGVTWSTPIGVNTDMAANDPARESSERVPLPGAAGNSDVKVKFVFQGDFYFWLVSRIQIIERENNNMQANDFFAIAPNRLTPFTQVDDIQFLIDVENVGSKDQHNVNVNVSIEDSNGNEVHTDDLDYGTVVSGFVDENRIFDNSFTPAATVENYTTTYTVTSDSIDFDESNNTQSYTFAITDSTFAKEEFGGGAVTPVDGEGQWTMAASYFVKNGAGNHCSSVMVNVGIGAEHVGGIINAYLYKWEDTGDRLPQSGERTVIGLTSYVIQAGDSDLLLILENVNDEALPVALEDDTHYLVAIEAVPPAGVTTQIGIGGSNSGDYNATTFVFDSLLIERYNAFWNTSEIGLNADYDLLNFAPTIRMHINEIPVGINQVLTSDNKVNIYPNPSIDVVNMELDLVEDLNNAVVRIVDLNARNVMEVTYDKLSNQTLTYSVANLASGTYFLKIQSDKGYITKKFTVVK